MEKISILIPTYNRSKFIQLCIMNILRQDYPKELLEVIILDDGQTPFIENEEYMKKVLFPIKLNYIKQKQKMTIGEKRNKLIKLSKNKIVCFMDDDDIYLPTYISYSYQKLKNNKAGLVGSNQMMFIYPHNDFKSTGIDCGEKKFFIHEATMMMTKKWYNSSNKFEKSSKGEGVNLIQANDKQVFITDIRQIMVCICHQNNTIDKTRFLENDNLKIELDPTIEKLIKNILDI
jgi:glycosyltransferase involved in cell wall biosynthesis